jgi:hypothetical protein
MTGRTDRMTGRTDRMTGRELGRRGWTLRMTGSGGAKIEEMAEEDVVLH